MSGKAMLVCGAALLLLLLATVEWSSVCRNDDPPPVAIGTALLLAGCRPPAGAAADLKARPR